MTLVIPSSKGHSTYLTLVDLSLSLTLGFPILAIDPPSLEFNIYHFKLSSALYGVSIVSMMQQLHVEEEILELKIVL
jgi:hypothetical protein